VKGLKELKVGKKQAAWTAVRQSTGDLRQPRQYSRAQRRDRDEEDTMILPVITQDTIGCVSK